MEFVNCEVQWSTACTVDYGMLSSKLACLNNFLEFHKKLWYICFSCSGAPDFPTYILLNYHSLWSCLMGLSSYWSSVYTCLNLHWCSMYTCLNLQWCSVYTCLNLHWTSIINSNSLNHKTHCVFCWKLTLFPEWQLMWLWSQHTGKSVGRVVPYESNFKFGRKMYVVGFNVSTAANI
jgi:hypothetical protein